MKYVKSLAVKFFLLIQLFSFHAFSQQSDSLKVSKDGKVSLFFEKVYLHLDRNFYSSGEDIWFKAYLLDQQNHQLSWASRNLYVELISPELKIISREIVRIDSGLGHGDFKLKDSIPEGTYHIRAYTAWMLNFGNAFVFDREIEIHSLKNVKSKAKIIDIDTSKVEIGFFPESGSMLEGREGVIGFKALNAMGKGCDATGKVVSSGGDTVAWFESQHLGMGKFSLLPEPGMKYYAVGKVGQVPFRSALPTPVAKGFSLRIISSDTANILLSITASPQMFNEYKDSVIILLGRTYGITYFRDEINLTKPQLRLKISKSVFPGGLASLTLYDKKQHPYCERLVYIDAKDKINISVTPNKNLYKPREKVTIKIAATDRYKNPVNANFSLAAVDGNQVSPGNGNIVSYFQLESEIKGKIERPEMYFDTTNQSRFRQLDLLLLTQGWRNFIWNQLTDSAVVISKLPEQGISISGRVREKFLDRPKKDLSVILLTRSNNNKNQVYVTTTNSEGKFFFNDLIIKSSTPILLSSKSKGLKGNGWILRDSLSVKPLEIPFKPTCRISKTEVDRFSFEADERQRIKKKYSLSDTIMLNEVLVKGQSQKAKEQEQEHMREGGFADYTYVIGPDDYNYPDVYSYLMNHLPGATRASMSSKNPDYSNPNRIVIRNGGQERPPRYVLNTFRILSDQEDMIANLAMEDIEKIFVSRNDSYVSMGGGMGSFVISIFTKPGAGSKKQFNILCETISGYYEARTFYSPRYFNPENSEEKDLRTTLHWVPNIKTNEKGEASIQFFNADKPTTIRVTVEGISDKGKAASGITEYSLR